MQYREIVINDELFINQEFDSVILSGKIGNPEFRTYTVEIPGKDGLLDLTESIDGSVHYNNRDIEFRVFIAGKRINERLDLLNNYHGQYVKLYSTYDNNYYYKGRLSVSIEERKATYAYVVLSFDCEPFKIKKEATTSIFIIRNSQLLKIKNAGRSTTAKIAFLQKAGDETEGNIALKVDVENDSKILQNISDECSIEIKSKENELIASTGRMINGNFVDGLASCKIKIEYTEIKI